MYYRFVFNYHDSPKGRRSDLGESKKTTTFSNSWYLITEVR